MQPDAARMGRGGRSVPVGCADGEGAVAARIVGAAPELAALLLSFLLHPFEHRFAAFGANRGISAGCLLASGFQTFLRHVFCEASLLFEAVEHGADLAL